MGKPGSNFWVIQLLGKGWHQIPRSCQPLRDSRFNTFRITESWLGTVNYSRRYIPDQLSKLLQKNTLWVLSETRQWPFEEHKRRLTGAPITAHFAPLKLSSFHTNALAVVMDTIFVRRDGQNNEILAFAIKVPSKALRDF